MQSSNTGATQLSKSGEDLIKRFEAFIQEPYRDSAGIPTIGWGTTHYENGKAVTMQDPAIMHERAEQLFQFEAQAKAYVLNQALQQHNVRLTQNQFDSLVSFSYNVGIAGLLGSTLFKLIKKDPQNPAIRDAFMMWDKITVKGKKVVSKGLVNRRKKEADLYFS
jgi:lysozyme